MTKIYPRNKVRVKMVKCIGLEPEPPCVLEELDDWCSMGYSAIPVQRHVGDSGSIMWVNPDWTVCVEFDDGDERVLHREEVEIIEG